MSAGEQAAPQLRRELGVLQATSINMSNMIGIGPFITVPAIIATLGGPQSLLSWGVGAALALCDGLVVAELGAALPGSGGSYVFLRDSLGREHWGRLMAFMFSWQFLFSGPLEIASAGIGMVQYVNYLWPPLAAHSLAMKLAACLICGLVVLSQYRRIKDVARLTFVLWIAALVTTGWVILSGMVAMNPRLLFDIPAGGLHLNWAFLVGLCKGTVLVIYNYLGYNQVRYLGDEVQRLEPGRGLVFLRRGLAAQEGGSSQKAEPATASHGTQVDGRRDCTAEKDLVGSFR